MGAKTLGYLKEVSKKMSDANATSSDFSSSSEERIPIRDGHAVVFHMHICGCGLCGLICAYPHETA